jgi:predicted Fe-Mo cluster-binding NifX family protein
MIITIPCVTGDKDSIVSDNFGRANFFYIFDTEKNQGQIFENEKKIQPHGVGIKTAEFILSKKTDVLIAPRVGEKAFDLLRDNLKIYLSDNVGASKNIELFLAGKLEEL